MHPTNFAIPQCLQENLQVTPRAMDFPASAGPQHLALRHHPHKRSRTTGEVSFRKDLSGANNFSPRTPPPTGALCGSHKKTRSARRFVRTSWNVPKLTRPTALAVVGPGLLGARATGLKRDACHALWALGLNCEFHSRPRRRRSGRRSATSGPAR